ncbi:hypothetical protein SDC9_99681 [bioreactor metagenome]|uniref:Uncharacterized protein n=1 Tax=bioreactor metagenome TaxID=1076179 RepID=A0A645AIR7_9ZZZZ
MVRRAEKVPEIKEVPRAAIPQAILYLKPNLAGVWTTEGACAMADSFLAVQEINWV